MIDAQEHVYDDDPKVGPEDVRTRLADVSYFFLGNGLIQAAVQHAPAGEGTALGLLIMDPDSLRKKREALTMDAEAGLRDTMLEIQSGGETHLPAAAGLRVAWADRNGLPAVLATWPMGRGRVEESFFCPDPGAPVLIREVVLKGLARSGPPRVRTGVPGATLAAVPRLSADGVSRLVLRYTRAASRRRIARAPGCWPSRAARGAWAPPPSP